MKQTSRVIWKADKKLSANGNLGYLYLATRIEGKQKLKSMDLPAIRLKDWLKRKSLVSDSFPPTDIWTSEKINAKIEIKLREASLAHHDFRYLPDEKKSFTEYWQQEIVTTPNNGTKQKYINVRSLLLEFANYEFGALDVKFKDISPSFIKSFFNYLRTKRNNTNNTAAYKLKSFQGMLNRAILDGIYYYPKNPFDSFEYKFEETMIKELLSTKELDRLFNTEYYEVYRGKHKFGQQMSKSAIADPRYKHKISLQDYRNFWLFQLFSQGMRVSDLLTLRWNDFKQDENKPEEIRIVKKMIKTKAIVTIYLNNKLIDILTPYVLKFCVGQEKEKWYKDLIKISNEIQSLKVTELRQKRIGSEIKKEKELQNSFGRRYARIIQETSLGNDENHIKFLKVLTDRKRLIIKKVIAILSTEFKTSFVFGILNDEDFKDVKENNDFGAIEEPQYNRLSGARTYYNRLLKCIAKQAKIKKNLTTHLARHSYTSLMIELGEDINLFDIMNSLGHKHISTTQTYMQKFTNKKLDNLNRILSDKLGSKWTINEDDSVYNPIQKPLR